MCPLPSPTHSSATAGQHHCNMCLPVVIYALVPGQHYRPLPVQSDS
jgi:hypothetical protein